MANISTAGFLNEAEDAGNFSSNSSMLLATTTTEPSSAWSDETFVTIMRALCTAVVFTYIYYVPRAISYRFSSLSEDKPKPHFFPVTYMVFVLLLLALCNCIRLYLSMGDRTAISDAHDMALAFWAVSGLNRVIAPMVLFIVVQQHALISSFTLSPFFLSGPLQHVYFWVVLVVVMAGSSLPFIELSTTSTFVGFYEPRWPHFVEEIILPLFIFGLYNYVRSAANKEAIYSPAEMYLPRPIDQMGKIVWFQGVMAMLAIVAMLVRDEVTPTSPTMWDFFASEQTPVLSWVAFRSILRKQRPTRPCFLVCCGEDEKSLPAGTSTTN